MKSFSNEQFKKSILEHFPDFKDSKFEFNHAGWTSVVADIDNQYICKFPRTEQKRAFLETENKLIEKFSRAFPYLEFPDREFINADIPFYIHQKLQGEFVTVEDYNQLSSPEQKNFIESTADFFAELHKLPIDNFQNIVKIKQEQLPDIHTLTSALEPDFNKTEMPRILEIVQDFNNLGKWSDRVVGYYDFHAHNVLFHKDSKKLKGIFDFDEVAIGTAKFDLREIFLNYNRDIGNKVVSAYNERASVPIPVSVVNTALVGWSLVEYINMKSKIINGELKDVDNINLAEFKNRIRQMTYSYKEDQKI